jgi:hypothetical protein
MPTIMGDRPGGDERQRTQVTAGVVVLRDNNRIVEDCIVERMSDI